VELPSPLHPPGNNQIPDVEIFEVLPLLLSVGLNVGDGGIGGEDVSPLVGILLLVEWEELVLIFQRTTRKTRSVRRLDSSMRMRGWDTPRGNTVGGGKDAVLATDGAETVRRGSVERHDSVGG